VTEKYIALVKDRSQQDAERMQHCEVLIEQLQRKTNQAEVGRARLLTVRKDAMFGRTGNPHLREQREKVKSTC